MGLAMNELTHGTSKRPIKVICFFIFMQFVCQCFMSNSVSEENTGAQNRTQVKNTNT